MVRPPLPVLLLCATLIAGCSGGGGADEPEADFSGLGLQATESTGVLRGVVVDLAVRPIEGVAIAGLGPGGATASATTNAEGLFGIDGLAPGDWFLTANRSGYRQVQSSAVVAAGVAEPPIVKILLEADPSTAPYVTSFVLEGFIECSVRPMFIAVQCGATDADIVHAEYELDRVPDHIQSEMVWESTQAMGDELSLSIRCLPGDSDPAERCPEGQRTIVRSEGHSPQVARINQTHAANWTLGAPGGNPLVIDLFAYGRSDMDVWDEETIDAAQKPVTGHDCMWWPNVGGFPFPDGTCMRLTGPGLMVNQKVDVYSHVFYHFKPAEDWQFSVSGPPEVPV